MVSATKAVSKGAETLDQEQPGWFEYIDLDGLNMKWPEFCIVGQLFDRLRELGVDNKGKWEVWEEKDNETTRIHVSGLLDVKYT